MRAVEDGRAADKAGAHEQRVSARGQRVTTANEMKVRSPPHEQTEELLPKSAIC